MRGAMDQTQGLELRGHLMAAVTWSPGRSPPGNSVTALLQLGKVCEFVP